MSATLHDRERLMDLLAERALFGLDDHDQKLLMTLLAEHPEVDPECMDRVAAAAHLGALDGVEVELPSDIADKVRASMPASLSSAVFENSSLANSPEDDLLEGPPVSLPSTEKTDRQLLALVAVGGWILAASLFVALIFPQFAGSEVAKLRNDLLANQADVIQQDWSTTEDLAAKEASGDVVWSNDAQQGVMVIRGLQANDRSTSQYQLWIIDKSQEHPIDGGVFDIPPGQAEVMIPIDAKIRVSDPSAFAVTVEKPGGVVVSKQERVVLLAAR